MAVAVRPISTRPAGLWGEGCGGLKKHLRTLIMNDMAVPLLAVSVHTCFLACLDRPLLAYLPGYM